MKKISGLVIAMLFLALPATANAVDFELPVPVNLNDEAVLFVQDMGIMTGSEDGQFHPEVSLSRCELSKIALLAGKITLVASSAPQAFSDISTNNWCHVYAATAKSRQILSGYPDGLFRPNQKVTQAEALKILLNTMRVKLPTTITVRFNDVQASDWWAPYVQFVLDQNIIPLSTHLTINHFGAQDEIRRDEVAFVVWALLTQSMPRQASLSSTTIGDHGTLMNEELVRVTDQYGKVVTFDIQQYCGGDIIAADLPEKHLCKGKNSLIVHTADHQYLLLDQRDTTHASLLPVLLGDPVSNVATNTFIGIAYPLEFCTASDGKCQQEVLKTKKDYINFVYFPNARTFKMVSHYPSTATIDGTSEMPAMAWNTNSTKAVFVPANCGQNTCPLMSYNLVKDEVKMLSPIMGVWSRLRWQGARNWTATVNDGQTTAVKKFIY